VSSICVLCIENGHHIKKRETIFKLTESLSTNINKDNAQGGCDMTSKILEEQLKRLNNKMRILVLKYAREEEDFDATFLQQINHLSYQILHLKTKINNHGIDEYVEEVPVREQEKLILH
jgi:hypothetical protein